MFEALSLPILLAALLVEAFVGYPDSLYQTIRHPVVWVGSLIDALEVRLNLPERRFGMRQFLGAATLLIVISATGAVAVLVSWACRLFTFGWLVEAVVASSLLAQRSLYGHVQAVADALDRSGLDGGRDAVSAIVGRNPEVLSEAGVCRAAIESLAENFCDGVVAPAIWLIIGGLPGIAIYKAINTADSMIGHRSPRYNAYGWAAARLDDLVNLPASRLSALLLVGAASLMPATSTRQSVQAVLRDAPQHRSPNAGWSEAAVAGALGLRLAGPRIYGDTQVLDAWMGDGRIGATSVDVRRALGLYVRACGLLWLLIAVALALIPI